MFDFKSLTVYQKAKEFNAETRSFLKTARLDTGTADQLRRASFSIVLNIAEGSGRFSKPDRKNFFVISRSSVFEWMAIYDVLRDEKYRDDQTYIRYYERAETLSKILFKMIQNLNKRIIVFSSRKAFSQ
jgi:four helix bundle protein